MSAYLVSDNHLNVLVSYFTSSIHGSGLWCKVNGEYTYLTPDNAKYIAYELHKENCRSLDHRYDEHNVDENYQFKYVRTDAYSPLEIAGAIDCLEYQSCEREDYHQSEAYSLLCNMRKHLLREMAEKEFGNETTWEISEIKGKKVTA